LIPLLSFYPTSLSSASSHVHASSH
jgi:hypothetical protein